MARGKSYDVVVDAPGAAEIRVRQRNFGGDMFLKSGLTDRLSFKTKKKQKSRNVEVARIQVKVRWKAAHGGGWETFPTRNVGSDQTIPFRSPVDRGEVAAPSSGGGSSLGLGSGSSSSSGGSGRRHNVTVSAPGAREIRIRQKNNGGDVFLKSALKESIQFKTKANQAGSPVSVARIEVRVRWKDAEGGIWETFPVRNVGSSQTIPYASPVARGEMPAPTSGGGGGGGGGSTGKRHDVTIYAPGAREIRVRQANHGGDTFLKSSLKEQITFKTKKLQKGKPVSIAKVRIKVFWKANEGGGSEWFGPRNVGSSQSFTLKSPLARGDWSPGDGESVPVVDTGWQPPADATVPPQTDFVPGDGGGYVPGDGGGYMPPGLSPDGLTPDGFVPGAGGGSGYETQTEETGGGMWKWALGGLALVTVAGGAAYALSRGDEQEGEDLYAEAV